MSILGNSIDLSLNSLRIFDIFCNILENDKTPTDYEIVTNFLLTKVLEIFLICVG